MSSPSRPEFGTDSMVGRFVRGLCPLDAGAELALLYQAGDLLVCANHFRIWARTQEQKQPCDNCGSTGNVWRDPMTRRNEYYCVNCHNPSHLFQNRWADWHVRESKVLGIHKRPECFVKGYAETQCRGEVKWRSASKASLCNRHAGKEGSGPNG